MRRPTWPRRVGLGLVAFCAAVMPALLSAPTASAHESESHHTWYVHVGLDNPNHSIQVMTFSPNELWIDAGDTVVWTTGAAEAHTVTLMPNGGPPPQPFAEDAFHFSRHGGSVYQSGAFFSSGVMSGLSLTTSEPQTQTYSLMFPQEGSVTYYCWIHPALSGVIHVNEQGAAYPHTQKWYDLATAHLREESIEMGNRIRAATLAKATNHWVAVGVSDGMVDVMRFLRSSVTIHVGQSITFTNLSMGPHTVTFGQEVVPPPVPIGDPTHYNGSAPLSSGFLFYKQSFTVTFTKAGTYDYFCALHDYMGMVGVVHVEP